MECFERCSLDDAPSCMSLSLRDSNLAKIDCHRIFKSLQEKTSASKNRSFWDTPSRQVLLLDSFNSEYAIKVSSTRRAKGSSCIFFFEGASMHFVRSSHFVRGSKGTSVVLKARLDAYRYASASVIPDGAPHGRPVYHFDKVSYLLTPSNRSQFLQKNIVPFLSVGSLKAMEAFQGRCLDKINTLTIDTPYHALPLYRLLHATQNDISKALIHQYASQAWNMDFFLSTLVSTCLRSRGLQIHPPNVASDAWRNWTTRQYTFS